MKSKLLCFSSDSRREIFCIERSEIENRRTKILESQNFLYGLCFSVVLYHKRQDAPIKIQK
ncbi:MAG: hypothetical protein A2909_02075 [Candidatus Tagabacteria bacterium RIFCSPLOWO2_01_FULL_39_11]|uniref:Uncharacterized protein n=1 Tax=Candidatus Tagabacteria bacterium RIFCSPLOWO2_01_FULL_39_11 TaxID=1802295 RepID=A0A1G2LQ66_9BACT|nr:MAG: hypothetical protein A2909_02075 [Candidatus Tagabacteria bacterium RIFCSPLOWO2_01_FULL_39_11]